MDFIRNPQTKKCLSDVIEIMRRMVENVTFLDTIPRSLIRIDMNNKSKDLFMVELLTPYLAIRTTNECEYDLSNYDSSILKQALSLNLVTTKYSNPIVFSTKQTRKDCIYSSTNNTWICDGYETADAIIEDLMMHNNKMRCAVYHGNEFKHYRDRVYLKTRDGWVGNSYVGFGVRFDEKEYPILRDFNTKKHGINFMTKKLFNSIQPKLL